MGKAGKRSTPGPQQTPAPHTRRSCEPEGWLDNKEEALVEQRARSRRAGAAKRRAQALFAEPVLAKIARHPNAKHSEIAKWLNDDPATAPLVAHLKPESLAKKISRCRRQK